VGAAELTIVAGGLLGIVALVLGIWVAVDASRLPEQAFERAGTSKVLWIVLPLAGIVACGVVAIVAAIVWFTSYRPKVVQAAGLAAESSP
jgi:hypothetical protein